MAVVGGQSEFLAYTCAAVGTAVSLYGVWSGSRARVRTDGRVVSVSEIDRRDDETRSLLAVAFQVDGQEHRVSHSLQGYWARMWFRPYEGQAVIVYFPLGSPEQATIDRWGIARKGLFMAAVGWAAVIGMVC
jgi:Protein of unknown function (DUF3592)